MSTSIKEPLLYSYFEETAKSLIQEYNRSSGLQASKNIGTVRESFCSNFLNAVIPSRYTIHEGGEIIDSKGHNTGEIDITIVRDDCPKLTYGNVDAYLAEGVFAVIEVKSNLSRSKIKDALNKLKAVKELEPNIQVVMQSGLTLDRPLRCVFAYEGATFETLLDEINQFEDADVIDYIGVINRGALIRKGLILRWEEEKDYAQIHGQAASIAFLYFHLIQYATNVLGRNLVFNDYFEPLNNWEKNESN